MHFPVQGQYRRKFCKGCHSRVAFPMDNCARCHPEMDNDW
jgi:CDGSH-type Zn-finger protein